MSEFKITHQICPPLFAPSEWAGQVQPLLDSLGVSGGAVVVVVEADPKFQNFPNVRLLALTVPERKSVRTAIERCRNRRREKNGQASGSCP